MYKERYVSFPDSYWGFLSIITMHKDILRHGKYKTIPWHWVNIVEHSQTISQWILFHRSSMGNPVLMVQNSYEHHPPAPHCRAGLTVFGAKTPPYEACLGFSGKTTVSCTASRVSSFNGRPSVSFILLFIFFLKDGLLHEFLQTKFGM